MKRDATPAPGLKSHFGPGCMLPIGFFPVVGLLRVLASGDFADKDSEQIWPYFLLPFILAAVVFLALFLWDEFDSSQCPKCRKWFAVKLVAKDYKRTGQTREIRVQVLENDGYRHHETVTQTQIIITRRWKCKFCGYEKTADVDQWQECNY